MSCPIYTATCFPRCVSPDIHLAWPPVWTVVRMPAHGLTPLPLHSLMWFFMGGAFAPVVVERLAKGKKKLNTCPIKISKEYLSVRLLIQHNYLLLPPAVLLFFFSVLYVIFFSSYLSPSCHPRISCPAPQLCLTPSQHSRNPSPLRQLQSLHC